MLENAGPDGSQLLDMSIAEKLNIPIGPKSRLIKYLVNLKAAAAARLHALPLLPGSPQSGSKLRPSEMPSGSLTMQALIRPGASE